VCGDGVDDNIRSIIVYDNGSGVVLPVMDGLCWSGLGAFPPVNDCDAL